MQKIDFEEAVEAIHRRDNRYAVPAYAFLRDALDYTLRKTRSDGSIEDRHVTGKQLVLGVRDYALKEFGPMVTTVLEDWGIHSCDDFGEIVFNLIDAKVFGRTDNDRKEDFCGHYDFYDAFEKPFLPEGAQEGSSIPTGNRPS